MKNLVIYLTLLTLGGILLAQEKTVEPGEGVTLKGGVRTTDEGATPEGLLPKKCKDWNVAELPGKANTIFVCKEGKWIEYVRKDKACSESKTESVSPKLIQNSTNPSPTESPNKSQTPKANPGPGEGGGADGGVYSVGADVSPPIPIYKPAPTYSEEAREAKVQGTVEMWIVINASGTVTDCGVVKSVGHGLDENAVETIKKWKFKPAMKNGSPVPVRIMVEIAFR